MCILLTGQHTQQLPDPLGSAVSLSPRLEVLLVRVALEVNQARKQQDHVPSLVHDRAVTELAPHLARQLVLHALRARIIPLQVMMSILEVDVVLLEDRGPLPRSSQPFAPLQHHLPSHPCVFNIPETAPHAASDKSCNGTTYCPTAPLDSAHTPPSHSDSSPHSGS